MNINFKSLLLGTSLSLIPKVLYAQCAVTDCQQLGYTSLKSCTGGLKCPFGEYWACPCDSSYQYTCTGSNEQPGTEKCGNKYKSCICTSGYKWKDGKCEKEIKPILGQCTGYAKNCKIADILNSDGTCTTNKESGKTPIGVVVYISGGSDKCGYAMTASVLDIGMSWSSEYVNTGVFRSTNWEDAIKDFDVSGNMTKIIQTANGNTYKYPAAYAVLNYPPNAAPTSKGKWVLPTAGILHSLYINLNAINNTILKLGGTQLTDDNEHIWSSSEYDDYSVWVFCTGNGAGQGGIGHNNKNYNNSDNSDYVVRPVIEF